jgi:hypothetical protein
VENICKTLLHPSHLRHFKNDLISCHNDVSACNACNSIDRVHREALKGAFINKAIADLSALHAENSHRIALDPLSDSIFILQVITSRSRWRTQKQEMTLSWKSQQGK